jgi:hypothetical protein
LFVGIKLLLKLTGDLTECSSLCHDFFKGIASGVNRGSEAIMYVRVRKQAVPPLEKRLDFFGNIEELLEPRREALQVLEQGND